MDLALFLAQLRFELAQLNVVIASVESQQQCRTRGRQRGRSSVSKLRTHSSRTKYKQDMPIAEDPRIVNLQRNLCPPFRGEGKPLLQHSN